MITQNYNSLCQEAKQYYYDCLCDESCGLIPESISSHIVRCRHCQKQISQLKVALSQKECIESGHRQDTSAVTTMLELHFAYIGKYITCKTVRPFLPGLLDPAIEIRIPTPITVHLDNCRQCTEDLKAIQKLNLHSTQLYGLSQLFAKGPSRDTTEFSEMAASVTAMAERADSEVVTIYHIDESAKARKADKSDDLYSGFPISVEVIKQKVDFEQPVSTINFAAALKKKVSAMNLKPLLKIGIPVAAVILIGFILLLNTTSAEALTIEQFYKAIESVKNVCISTFSPDRNELIQEIWISHTLNIYMTKTGKEFVLCDINTGLMKSKNFDTGVSNIVQLNKDAKAGIEQRISGSLGLMPVYNISDLPKDFEWLPVDAQIPEAAERFEIYDLKWTEKINHSYVLKKWRFFVDPKTFLPKEIEVYKTSLGQSDYNLISVYLAESKSDSEIRKVIQDAGF